MAQLAIWSLFYQKIKTAKLVKWLIVISGMAFILLTLSFGVMEVTSTPNFCANCHQIESAVSAWSKAPHKGVPCLSCHADPGTIGYVKRKIGGLGEVYKQLSGSFDPNNLNTKFNISNCINCHTTFDKKYPTAIMISTFHKYILDSKVSCLGCHKTVGHGDFSKNKNVEIRQ